MPLTRPGPRRAGALLRASHPGPTVAVTLLVTAFAVSSGLSSGRLLLVVGAVLTGQLSIGWCNDLVDLGRDRAVGRTDKPLATGELPVSVARTACAVAVASTVVLSLACGLVAGLVHLVCVAAGWAYDLGMKSTVLSWLPYAVAFGGLPVFVVLAQPGDEVPAPWVPLAGALLGIGAHFVNVVPDLADDRATGVQGLGHRLGARRATLVAVVALVAATGVVASAVTGVPALVLAVVLVGVAVLAVVAVLGHGRTPFRAAIAVAAVDVALLVVAAR